MKLFDFLLRRSRATVVLAVIFGLLSGACTAGLLAIVSAALRRDRFSATTLVLSFIGLCLLTPIAKSISDLLLVRLGYNAVFELRMKLSKQVLAAPLRHLEEIGPHRLLATLTEDISVIINSLLLVPLLCINTAIVVGCLIYLGWLSFTAFALVLGFMLLGGFSYQLALRKGIRFQRLAREQTDALFSHFRALTTGTKELKLNPHRREAFVSDVLQPTALSLRGYNIRTMTYFIAASSWGQILFFVFTGILLFILPAIKALSIETLTACILTALFMRNPLDSILNTVADLSRASVALKKVETLGLSLEADAAPDNSAALTPPAQSRWKLLELDGVTHTYHREKENSSFLLGPLDLSFSPAEIVFIIGGNGSGKTTLVKLLTGLYTPESGEIRVDGQPINEQTMENFRQHFSVVFSDFYLFESLLGIDSPELDANARYYLAQLHLDHKVQVKDGVFSTTDLSQGQRKRLALLTAYLEDRSIYVFDEWAADQDPQFKEIFYLQILPMLKARGKTVVVISHDDRYYSVADRIIKLENGQLEYDNQLICAGVQPAGITTEV
ncbi:MAG TPA: cyclic peptide export ABC transporter [Pyrinomonadaceae bacterium]